MLHQRRQLTRMRFIHVHPMAILVLLLALTASNVFAVDVPWTGNGTNNGYCESSNQNPGVPVGMQLWLFVLTSPADSGPYQLTATFAPGGTITVTGTPRGNGAVHFEVLTTAGAQVVSAVATGGTSKSNLVVSHCDVNNPALVVSKDAHTSYSRTYTWAIEKSVSPSVLDMFVNDSGTATYTVSVTRTGFYDSGWSVSGNIYIHNPSSVDATLASVTDDISGVGSVAVSCPGSVVPAGSTMTCSYSSSLPDGSPRVNTATVTTTGTVAGGSGQADITFGAPSAEYLASVSVVDSMTGSLGSFNGSGSVSYNRTFDCYGDAGTHDNTATIEQTGQSDSASVQVNCYELEVSKTAVTSGGGGGHWEIEKWVEPETLDLFVGDSADVQYYVQVTHTSGGDGGWAVSGEITIYNPSPLTANLDSVSDYISDFGPVPVDCPTLTIAPYDVLVCTYSAELPDGQERLNTAVATLQNTPGGTTDFTGSAAIVFEDPGGSGSEPVDVIDTLMGVLAEDLTSDWDTTYPYTYTCGESDSYPNTASIVSQGGTVLDSDTANVQVNCHELEVTKTADSAFTRTWNWSIDKSADQGELVLAKGESAVVTYSVGVDATPADSDWAVTGTIDVHNPAPIDAVIDGVSDVIDGVGSAVVDCDVTFPYTLAAGDTLQCTYSAALPDNQTRVNGATATLLNTPNGTTDFSGTADVVFGDTPASEADECIVVSDTFAGELGTVCASDGLPYTFAAYTRDAGPYGTCGPQEPLVNTAAFVTNDSGATGEDTVTIPVEVTCDEAADGCTPGYWKNHTSNWGPTGYLPGDHVSAMFSATPAPYASKTLLQALNLKGGKALNGAREILLRAAVAAMLNASDPRLNYALSPAEIQALVNAVIAGNDRGAIIDLAALLDGYNNAGCPLN